MGKQWWWLFVITGYFYGIVHSINGVISNNVLWVKIGLGRVGIPSIIIYLLLKGWGHTPFLINQPMRKDIYGYRYLYLVEGQVTALGKSSRVRSRLYPWFCDSGRVCPFATGLQTHLQGAMHHQIYIYTCIYIYICMYNMYKYVHIYIYIYLFIYLFVGKPTECSKLSPELQDQYLVNQKMELTKGQRSKHGLDFSWT